MNWQRHQLVWLNAEGWQGVLAGPADEPPWSDSARDCLQHGAANDWPLVVTRQAAARAGVGEAPKTWALGLAAPLRWNRQRLFVHVAAAAVQRTGAFPLAADITRALPTAAREDWRTLCTALQAAGLAARVYGSYGWQALTGLPCVREAASDIDLLLPCTTPAQADAAVAVLNQAGATLPHLDGECVFPDGAAVAWREWSAWRAGAVRQVLVKRLHGAALEGVDGWKAGA
jgi:phosphoribosyl-dephospho-CoA transferase